MHGNPQLDVGLAVSSSVDLRQNSKGGFRTVNAFGDGDNAVRIDELIDAVVDRQLCN